MSEEIAERIIRQLDGRKGFDHWWHDIRAEDKADIIKDLGAIFADAVKTKNGLLTQAAEMLDEVRTGSDFEVECHSIASTINALLWKEAGNDKPRNPHAK
jgi:hypothetical protein